MADVDPATDEPQAHEPRERRLWPWLVGVLVLGVGIGVAAALLITDNGDNSPHVAASAKPVGNDQQSAPTSTTAPVATTTPASASGTGAGHGGPSGTPGGNGSGQAKPGGNAGGTGTTTTSSTTTTTTTAEAPAAKTPPPTFTMAAVQPTAVCSGPNRNDFETLSWATENATVVYVSVVGYFPPQPPTGSASIDGCENGVVHLMASGPGGSTTVTVKVTTAAS